MKNLFSRRKSRRQARRSSLLIYQNLQAENLMMDPLAIHGLTSDNYAESSSSGLSEFDEEYLRLKPPPQEILKENIIVIKPSRKSKKGVKKSRKKVKASENVPKNKPTVFYTTDEYGITNSYIEADNPFDALSPSGCEFDDNGDLICLENMDPVATNTVDSADGKNELNSIIKKKKKRKKVANEMQSKICEITTNIPKSEVSDTSLLSKSVEHSVSQMEQDCIVQNGLLSKARKKKNGKPKKKIKLSSHDPKYTLDNCEENVITKTRSENMIRFGIDSVEDSDSCPTIRTFQEVIPAKEMPNNQRVSTVNDMSDNYNSLSLNSAQENLSNSEMTDTFVDSDNDDCTIGSVHSEHVDQFVNAVYFCRSQNAIESELEMKKNVGNKDLHLQTEPPVERVLGLYWNPNDNNFSLNFGVDKTSIIPQREARDTNRYFENYTTMRTIQEVTLENDLQNVPNAIEYIGCELGDNEIDSLRSDFVDSFASNKDLLNEQNELVAKIKKKKRNRKRKKISSEVHNKINDIAIAQENLTTVAVFDDNDYNNESVHPEIVNQAVINTKDILNIRNATDSIGSLSLTQKNIPDSEVSNTALNAFEISKNCYKNQSVHSENMTHVTGTVHNWFAQSDSNLKIYKRTFSPGSKSIYKNYGNISVNETFEECSVRLGNNSKFQEFKKSTSTRTCYDDIPVNDFYRTDMADLMSEQSSERVNFKNSSKRHSRVKLRNRNPISSSHVFVHNSDVEGFDYVPGLQNNAIYPVHYPSYISSLPKKYPSYFELFYKYLYSKRKTVFFGIIVYWFWHKNKTPIEGSLGTLASTRFSNDLIEKYFDSSFHINNLFI